jgi:hypothetical protein
MLSFESVGLVNPRGSRAIIMLTGYSRIWLHGMYKINAGVNG